MLPAPAAGRLDELVQQNPGSVRASSPSLTPLASCRIAMRYPYEVISTVYWAPGSVPWL